MTPLERLSSILDILRRDCPWDRAQTFESIRYLTIEEVYELSDAILALTETIPPAAENAANLKKELGDILMHILFYSKIAHDAALFDFNDVCEAVSDKLFERHPHISLPDANGVMQTPRCKSHPGWEKIKMKEGRKSVLEGVPSQLPSLVKAVRLQEKAEGIGYPLDAESTTSTDKTLLAGSRLFKLIQEMRQQGINPDEALSRTNNQFERNVRQWETSQR